MQHGGWPRVPPPCDPLAPQRCLLDVPDEVEAAEKNEQLLVAGPLVEIGQRSELFNPNRHYQAPGAPRP